MRWKQEATYTAPGDPLFANEVGRPLDYSALRKDVLRQAIVASGIDWPKGVAFHMLRRTAASILHHHGKSGRQLCDWLGHHDPAFTIKTYVGKVDEGLGDASFLDELIPPQALVGDEAAPGGQGDADQNQNDPQYAKPDVPPKQCGNQAVREVQRT